MYEDIDNKYVICNTKEEWLVTRLIIAHLTGQNFEKTFTNPYYVRFNDGTYRLQANYAEIKHLPRFCSNASEIPLSYLFNNY